MRPAQDQRIRWVGNLGADTVVEAVVKELVDELEELDEEDQSWRSVMIDIPDRAGYGQKSTRSNSQKPLERVAIEKYQREGRRR